MEISDKLLCLFSAEIEETEDRFVVEVPRHVGDRPVAVAAEASTRVTPGCARMIDVREEAGDGDRAVPRLSFWNLIL